MPVIFLNSLLLLSRSVLMSIVLIMPTLKMRELKHREVIQNVSPGSLVAQSMVSTTLLLRGLHYSR